MQHRFTWPGVTFSSRAGVENAERQDLAAGPGNEPAGSFRHEGHFGPASEPDRGGW